MDTPYVPMTPAGPAFVNFLINNVCNSRCRFCTAEAQRQSGKLDRIDTSDETLGALTELHVKQQRDGQGKTLDCWRRWTTNMPWEAVPFMLGRYRADVRHVSLCAFGEPMLHPDFDKMAQYVIHSPNGLTLAVTTNGSLLHRCMEIGDAPGQLVISFDAFDAATFEHFRPGLSHARVVENMRAVGARKNHARRKLYAQMAVFERNHDQVFRMVQFLVDMGFHGLSINRGYDHGIAPEQPVPRSDPRVLSQIAQVKGAFPACSFHLIDNFTTHDGEWAMPKGRFCVFPWQQIEVLPDGSTDVCCRAIYESMGRYNENVWLGRTMHTLRTQLATFSVDPEMFPGCAACSLKGEPR
jgi:wyosine [tRNA(Phe)-imidazoG37] synthetase (radical SAM superfamily)